MNHGHASTDSTPRRENTLNWLPLLQRLHELRNPRPRKRTAIQQFMVDYPDVVKAAFVAKYLDTSSLTSAEKMNARHDVAKSLLFSDEYSHLATGLHKKAVVEHEADMEEWQMILDGISAAQDVSQ